MASDTTDPKQSAIAQRAAAARSGAPTPKAMPARPRMAPAHQSRVLSRGIEERHTTKPLIFNYGADLTPAQREVAKARIATLALIVVVIACVGIVAWGWLNDNVIVPSQPVATVNGVNVRKDTYQHMASFVSEQLNSQIATLQNQLAALGTTSKNATLRSLIQQQLSTLTTQQSTVSSDTLTRLEEVVVLQQGAKKMGLVPTAAQLTSEKNTFIKQMGGTTLYQQILQATKLTSDEFMQWVIAPATIQPLVQNQLNKGIPMYVKQVDARHILVATKTLATSLATQIKHGANFATLAKKYSTDTGSAKNGGDLGFFGPGQMVAPFENAAFSMKVGEVRVVQTQYGWHVIQVLAIHPKVKRSASDLTTAQQTAFSNWINQQLTQASISPASAQPLLSGSTTAG